MPQVDAVALGETAVRTLFFVMTLLAGCSRSITPVEEISVGDSGSPLAPLPNYVAADVDWPGWRGVKGNGISLSPSAPTTWTDAENVVWKSEVPGRGHASPVVRGDHVLLTTALESEQRQVVVAFDRSTGSQAWQTIVHEEGFPSASQLHRKGTHANGTAACDDEHIFVAFLNDDSITASALDFEGTVIWQTKLGAFDSKFGYAPSPVVYRSLIIVAADNMGGGYLTALHRKTGEIIWRKARPAISTYSSPVVAHVAGRDQLLLSGCRRVTSYDPNTGEELWSCTGTAEATCGTVVWNDSLVFAAGGYPDRQVIGVMADGSGKEVWSESTRVYEPSMIVVDDHLYAVTDDGIAHCWQATTGESQWKKRLGGSFSASPVFCNGLVYVSRLDGTTLVFQARPDRYEEVARNRLGDDTYASPAICNGQIFLRVGVQQAGNRQEILFCIGEPSAPI